MGMEEYPRNLMEFEKRFGSEKDCREYLFRLRWPNGFICPKCGGQRVTRLGAFYRCLDCRRQISATAGTIFHRSHIPLLVWFRGMWWLTSQKNGASALGLQRVLGLGSYEAAWLMLHKLRRAMIRPNRDRLAGVVEVDETYLGSLEEGLRGRQTEDKTLIILAVQENGKGIGRIRMKQIPDASAAHLQAFVESAVEPGSKVRTDGWTGYAGLSAKGYTHDIIVIRKSPKTASDLLPRVHRVVSLLKRWLMGTHQGAVSHDHLDYYLDEFTFRFNRRTSRHRGKLFYRLAEQAIQVKPSEYSSIVKHVRGLSSRKHNL
jgi:transposase-like protein